MAIRSGPLLLFSFAATRLASLSDGSCLPYSLHAISRIYMELHEMH